MAYDSSKSYKWDPSASFTISGREFGLFLNTCRAILNTEEAARIFLVQECAQMLEKQLAAGVESGIVTEQEAKKEEK